MSKGLIKKNHLFSFIFVVLNQKNDSFGLGSYLHNFQEKKGDEKKSSTLQYRKKERIKRNLVLQSPMPKLM